MRTRFRGITVREGALIEGPAGWGEFSPFAEYGPRECARWLACALEAACAGWPAPVRDRVGGERDRARGRAGAGARDRGRLWLPDREGQGRRARARPRPTTSPGWRRCGTRSGRTAGSGSTPTAAGTVDAGRADAAPRWRRSAWSTPSSRAPPWTSWPSCGGGSTCRWPRTSRSAAPRTRWRCARPGRPTSSCSRRSRWAASGPRCGWRPSAGCRWWCPARWSPRSGSRPGWRWPPPCPSCPTTAGWPR